jgi:hypothetical protein
MATIKQRQAARENIKKAQATWQSMTKRQRTLAQPEGRRRSEPGSKGRGNYFRIIVRPKSQFTSFRNQDVGDPGGLQRISGRRRSGSWATQAWLINKEYAHIEGDTLVPDRDEAKTLLDSLGSRPIRKAGDVFIAKDRRNVPEKEKPTSAQHKAWLENIRKAQAARRKSTV